MVSVSSEASGKPEYSDHEVQICGLNTKLDKDVSANDQVEVVENYDPVEPRYLDNNELAELVYLRIRAQISEGGLGGIFGGDLSPAKYFGEFSIGINLSKDEHQIQAFNNGPNAFESTDPAEDPSGILQQYRGYTGEQGGQLDSYRTSCVTVFEDETSGAGGVNDNGAVYENTIDYRNSAFGTGPVLDSTDELSLFQETGKSGEVASNITHDVNVLAVWRIHEVEGVRPEFSLRG